MGNTNKSCKRETVDFHHQVVSLLCEPKPAEKCPLKLAYYLADLVRQYTGDCFVNNCKAFEWPESMGTEVNTTMNTRRVRLLDRVVKYSEEFGYSHIDTYNAFFSLCPHVEGLVRINKGQAWEPENDWFVYDIFAKVALLCVPNKSSEFLTAKANEVVNEIDQIYQHEDAQKVREICKYLEQQIRECCLGYEEETFGFWVSKCIEHYCQVACNDQKHGFQSQKLVEVANYIMHYCFMHPKLWFNSPHDLVAVSVNSAVTFLGVGSWGNWYTVEFRTAVRSGILLDSDTVSLLNPGQQVHIVQQFGRRVQIDQPVRGFCSLHDGAGLDILKPNQEANLLETLTGLTHEKLQSPFRDMTRWIFTERTSTYSNLKAKFSRECHCSVSSLKFQNGQLIEQMDTEFE